MEIILCTELPTEVIAASDITSGLNSLNLGQIFSVSGKGETDTLFLFGNTQNNGDEVFLSTDNGNNWTSFYQVSNKGGNIKLDNLSNNNFRGYAVCGFGGKNKTFIMAIEQRNNNSNSDFLYELRNGNMVQLNTTGLPNNLHITYLKHVNSNWLLGTTVGLYQSPNGINWTTFNNANYYLGMYTQQIYYECPYLVIGTNNGIWRHDASIHSVNVLPSGTSTVCSGSSVNYFCIC